MPRQKVTSATTPLTKSNFRQISKIPRRQKENLKIEKRKFQKFPTDKKNFQSPKKIDERPRAIIKNITKKMSSRLSEDHHINAGPTLSPKLRRPSRRPPVVVFFC
jgi:hypothetical protein